MSRRRVRTLGIGVVAATLAAPLLGVGAASATTLGGVTPAKLTALTMAAATGAPTVLAWENFTGTTGLPIAGTTTDGGAKVWTVNPLLGVWQFSSNTARSTSTDSSLVIDPGTSSYTLAGAVARNGATTFDAGFTLDRNLLGTQFLSCEWTSAANGSIELWKYNSGWTALASVTNLYPAGVATAPASIALSCTTTGTTFSAAVNGVTVVTYSLTPPEQAMFKKTTQQLGGPFQHTSDGVTWDDVHVDSP